MRKLLALGLSVCLTLTAYLLLGGNAAGTGGKAGPQIAHMVYFALKDNSPKAQKALVDACNKHLSKHPGTIYFSAGTLATELKRPVNDVDFDVALHLVFKDKAAHDVYQDAPRHTQFINENKDNWKKVRVFDAVVSE